MLMASGSGASCQIFLPPSFGAPSGCGAGTVRGPGLAMPSAVLRRLALGVGSLRLTHDSAGHIGRSGITWTLHRSFTPGIGFTESVVHGRTAGLSD